MTTALGIPNDLPIRLRLRIFAARIAAAATGGGREADAQRFDEIVRTQSNLIASICLQFSKTKEDFEDLRQDALLNIWRGIGRFREESALSTWVYRVTLNTCVSYRRRNGAGARQTEAFAEFYRTLFDSASPEELERYELMHRMIARLKPLDRSVLVLWLDDMKYERIAEVIGLSRDAVAARLKRIRDHLAEMAAQTVRAESECRTL